MKLYNENMCARAISQYNKNAVRQFVMSIDVDGWPSLLRFYSVDHDPSEADRQVDCADGILKLVGLFEKHDVKATFFVTGEMAQKHPSAVRTIIGMGHEVSCHGLYHGRNECLLSGEEQKAQIEKAIRILKDITGQTPLGFRAPCLRANKTTLKVLSEIGFLYDSSFSSMFIPTYYGSVASPHFKPYHPLSGNSDLLEIPVSGNPLAPLPLSGSWMRNLGLSWVKFGIKTLFKMGCPVMFYVHPRDILPLPRVSGVPWHLYPNTGKRCLKMLDELLEYVKRLNGQMLRAIDLAMNVKSQENS